MSARDGDHQPPEDEVAPILPLRRREGGEGRQDGEEREGAGAGATEAPAGAQAEQPEQREYSVWDAPSAELLRRKPADEPGAAGPPHEREAAAAISPKRWLKAAGLAGTGMVAVLLVGLALGTHQSAGPVALRIGGSGPRQRLAAISAPSGGERRAVAGKQQVDARAAPRLQRAAVVGGGRRRSSVVLANSRVAIPAATTGPAPASGGPQGQSGSAAAWEFGFER